MDKFVDRVQEMECLVNEYQRRGSSLVILYGRRRVGKTALLKEFIRNKKALYFLATEESETQNRNAFRRKAADFLGNHLLQNAEVREWEPLFRTIADTEFDAKPVLILDEFQYLGKANPAFSSIFQRIWDEVLKDRDVMVILCGSLISMMESQTLSYRSPLYGRRTAQIRMQQIPFRHYHEFFPRKSRREQIEFYSVTGGVPRYIESFPENGDIYQAIEDSILNPSGYLYDEPNFLLRQEVTEIGSYFSLLKVIAAGNQKLSSISSALEVKATGLTKYLKTLADLDLVEREVPITEDNPEKSKRGLYRIKDNYIRFWFLFLYPNRGFLESGYSDIVMKNIRGHLIDRQTAYVYEEICREHMWELNAGESWPFTFSKVGRWWDGHHEIDVAALDMEGRNLVLGECKFWSSPVGKNVLDDLQEKSMFVSWHKEDRRVWYVLFSISGFTHELQEEARHRKDLMLIDDSNIGRNAV